MAAKKKVIATVAAVATSAALLLGGTMAWQSANQVALNEASDVINPGGRLHDDFNGENKDVYVENFADENIYARIRLEEYFEIITNYGKGSAEKPHELIGSKTTNEETDEVEYTYELFTGYDSIDQDGVVAAASHTDENSGETTSYWSWQTGGSTVYMPTFNLNKDSLAADLNGNYVDAVGGISDRVLDLTAENAQYSDYTNWAEFVGENDVTGEGATMTGTEIYDADANNLEDDGITTVLDQTHIATTTLDAELISMDEWLGKVVYDDEGNVTDAPGNYWVYDEDGWVYWSAPIEPDSATGLLLDGIELNQVMDDTWYYAINVIAQFVTADDVGKSDNTGFYDETDDYPNPSAEAEELLAAIGVDMSGEAADDGDDEGGDDEGDDNVAFNIMYADMNENNTIYVSNVDFASEGGGIEFKSFRGDLGEYLYADEADWTLTADDENEYIGAENETGESVFTVNVNKPASELEDGDKFTFTVTTTNTAFPGQSFTVNMTVIIGEAPSDGSDSESALTMSVDMKEPSIDEWIYPDVTITSSTDPDFTYDHENDLSCIDIKFYTDEERTYEADAETQIKYDSNDCSYFIYEEGTYYYTATYTNGDLTASCEGVVEYYKPEVDFDLSVNYDSALVSYDTETNTYTMNKASTTLRGDTTIEFALTGAIGEESVDVSLIGEESMDEALYVRDTSYEGSATGFTYYNDTNGNKVCYLEQGGPAGYDDVLVGENLYNVTLYPTNSSFSVSFTYYYDSIEYDTITVNFVVNITE